ncbi:MAG: SDR family NAD(P)-dependent oxidoreductase [Chloroflexota bacterium]|nr:SDR family NAD(P)-dependent oxidoreductase [Chloroflexota bacterium]
MFEFKDKVIVITGAAGNLGKAVVNSFLTGGGRVCALGHRHGSLKELFSAVEALGELHLFEGVDVTDRKAMIALAEKIHNQVGQVEILVNTIGGFAYGDTVYEMSSTTWQSMMNLNVKSFLNASTAFVPGMVENGHGKIISIGSKSSLQGGVKTGAYAATKGALLRLTESMAAELKPHDIQVNCVLPSTIDTPENRKSMPSADFTKWVKPEDIAQVILFLSSSMSDAITGAAVPVFGRA